MPLSSFKRLILFALLAGLCGLYNACSVQKRKYRPGYHTENPAKPTSGNIDGKKNEPVANGDTSKSLSSPFYSDSSSIETAHHSTYCDTIYYNDGHIAVAKVIGREGNDITYRLCAIHHAPTYRSSVYEIKSIKKADGYVVDGSVLRTNTGSDSASCDKIYYKNGTEKMVYITETNSDEIKYRECGDKNGIIYGVSKKEVIMIKRANGSYDTISSSADNVDDQKQAEKTTPRNNPDDILNDRFFWFIIRLFVEIIF